MRFFFDNCLSHPLARAIAVLEENERAPAEVKHLKDRPDRFDEDADDVDWIPVIAKEADWVVVTGDLNIRRRANERQIWRDAGLVTFFMAKGWTNLRKWDQAWKFVRQWPEIRNAASRAKPGQAWLVPVGTGKLEGID